ncbi:putative E3 ubiquitin-protein ligase RING1a [Impatiens glandulifera]|uniref:putative E3 ubiquitin-protein ligase RING1a n=1 Tax=Impatiens glandulifera TaxID=253017 RepID=UPI001FB10B6E|nr:putative E3 ubiquitin-protein ligase RING1a [Impatiens glandulifera]
MVNQDSKQSSPQQNPKQNTHKSDCIFLSPRFKSAAAIAGWDEEALRLAFEDTPDRLLKSKKRSDSQSITTPSANSSRKRRTLKRNSVATPVPIINLDEIETLEGDADSEKKKKKKENLGEDQKRKKKKKMIEEEEEEQCPNSSVPCIDRLREELSCAICLEICFEPSTTTCGHSFCKKCLQSAADKCGKRCPKCRQQLISNGKSCSLNTVLWNTIQLLFPEEVEQRKKALLVEEQHQTPLPARNNNRNGGGGYNRNRIVEALNSPEDEQQRRRRRILRRAMPSQDEDAALALRLQRQEFMEVSRENQQQRTSAGANLRAIASRAVTIRRLRGGNTTNNRERN